MPLSEQLIRSAVLGTQRQPFVPDAADVLPDLAADETPEAALLLTVAGTNLREWAGHIPGHSHLPVPDVAQAETTVLCGSRAMQHLRMILDGTHGYVLREWLIAAVRAKQHVHEAILPELLLLGQKVAALRPYLLPVVGQRGQWLAYEISNQNWNWSLETPAVNIDEMVEFERWQETEMLKLLDKNGLSGPELRPQLEVWSRTYRMVWSHELMRVFLWAVGVVTLPKQYGQYLAGTISRICADCAYYFPLDMQPEILDRLIASPVFVHESSNINFKAIVATLDFRQTMLNAIETRED